MNELVAIVFEDELDADEYLIAQARAHSVELARVVDSAVAIKTERGKLRVRQTTEISGHRQQVPDGWWGLLVGLMVGGPITATHFGEAYTALAGRLDELGIERSFIDGLSETMEPGRSVLFVLHRAAPRGPMGDDPGHPEGRVFRTMLSDSSICHIGDLLRKARRDAGSPHRATW